MTTQNQNMYQRLNNKNAGEETLTDGRKTETTDLSSAPISDSYGSTSSQDQSNYRCFVPWCGLVFYVMSFFGHFCSLLLREGLSVAIVAMVNQTAVAEENVMTNVTEVQCPRQPVSELQYESGEFNWNRNQQGILLTAFYIGYGVTQVCIINISGANAEKPATLASSCANICESKLL